MMDVADLARLCHENSRRWFPSNHTTERNAVTHCTLGLAGEAGETANKVKKLYGYMDQRNEVPPRCLRGDHRGDDGDQPVGCLATFARIAAGIVEVTTGEWDVTQFGGPRKIVLGYVTAWFTDGELDIPRRYGSLGVSPPLGATLTLTIEEP